jgi:hypothetical protein
MTTIDPGITGRAVAGTTGLAVEPLVVRPRVAWRMLDCGNTHGYELLNAGELDSFKDGEARKIVVESIYRYIARMLAAAGATGAPRQAAQPRRRGRPRKRLANEASS